LEMRDREPAREERALEVDVDRAVPLLLGGLGGRPLDPDPGAVHEDVQPRAALDRLLDHPAALGHLADVDLDGVDAVPVGREIGNDLEQALAREVGQRHEIAALEEAFGDRAADPSGAAGAEDHSLDLPHGSHPIRGRASLVSPTTGLSASARTSRLGHHGAVRATRGRSMDALDLSRWQFAVTIGFHFLFVPLSIGLAFLVAVMQTAWYRSGNETYLRMTRFWGKLFLVNFALGVVTGIVQEFQFGMNWSSYSRFVGDVFGAPLAIEGLLAFFLESTFLGLWIFGWKRLSPRVHLATIWLVAFGTMVSALFIRAANSWMQHPVGYRVNPITGRAERRDFFAMLTNPALLAQYPHTVL